jgi:hypothetical protein
MVAKHVLLRPTLRAGNSQKSLGVRSREYGGWVMTAMLFSTRNCFTTSDVWLGANAPSHTSLVVIYHISGIFLNAPHILSTQYFIQLTAHVTINIYLFLILLPHVLAHKGHLQGGYSKRKIFIINTAQDTDK